MTRKEFLELMLIPLKAQMDALDSIPRSLNTDTVYNDRLTTKAQIDALVGELTKIERSVIRVENMQLRGDGMVPDCEFQYQGDEPMVMCRKDGSEMYGKPCDGKRCTEPENDMRVPTVEELLKGKPCGFLPKCQFQTHWPNKSGWTMCSYTFSPHFQAPCSKRCTCVNGLVGGYDNGT
jgi:hypothetical protein